MSSRLLRNLVRRFALALAFLLISLQVAAAFAACHDAAVGLAPSGVASAPCGGLDSDVPATCAENLVASQHVVAPGEPPHPAFPPAIGMRAPLPPLVGGVFLPADFHLVSLPLHLLYGRLLN